jgi:hypothetical protein
MNKDIPLKDMLEQLRKMLPEQVAKSILSVQPIGGRGHGKSTMFSSIYHRHSGIKPPREIFNHFLRVNNRKKIYNAEDFLSAGYPYVDTSHMIMPQGHFDWMIENLKHRYICSHNHIFFAEEKDKIMYLLRWSQ